MENRKKWLISSYYLLASIVIILLLGEFGVSPLCQCLERKIDCRYQNLTSLSWTSRSQCNNSMKGMTFSLDLSHNAITLACSGMNTEYLQSVSTLDLSFNNIEELCKFVDSNENLDIKVFNFSYNRITSLQRNVLEPFNAIKVLDLSNNQIITIENGTFSSLIKLEDLNLSSNALDVLHIRCPDVLKHLNLKDNKLEKIFLHGQLGFQILDLSCNNFSIFPLSGEDWRGKVVFGGNPFNCNLLSHNYAHHKFDCGLNTTWSNCFLDEDNTSYPSLLKNYSTISSWTILDLGRPTSSSTALAPKEITKKNSPFMTVYTMYSGVVFILTVLVFVFLYKWCNTRRTFERYSRPDLVYGRRFGKFRTPSVHEVQVGVCNDSLRDVQTKHATGHTFARGLREEERSQASHIGCKDNPTTSQQLVVIKGKFSARTNKRKSTEKEDESARRVMSWI